MIGMHVDDCFSKKKKDKPVDLLELLNNYHPNIVFTVEENPDHFLDNAKSTRNRENYLRIGSRKFLQNRKEITSLAPSTAPNVSLLILTTKSKQLKNFSNYWIA